MSFSVEFSSDLVLEQGSLDPDGVEWGVLDVWQLVLPAAGALVFLGQPLLDAPLVKSVLAPLQRVELRNISWSSMAHRLDANGTLQYIHKIVRELFCKTYR